MTLVRDLVLADRVAAQLALSPGDLPAHTHGQADITGLVAALAALNVSGGQPAIANLATGGIVLLSDAITAITAMQAKVNTLLGELRTSGLLLP